MRIAMVYNPRSGRGKAERLTAGIMRHGQERGHTLDKHDMLADPGAIEASVREADRVVIVGGDGTVHHLLPMLARCRTPAYHCGTGTANLIGREFGMSRSPARVLRDLEGEHEPRVVDLPECNGYPFLIMVSMGIDASVIHRLEESRTLGGYRAYVRPVIREVLHPRPASFTVEGDEEGARHLSTTGILIIANMRSYGGGFNPCTDACCDDGMLDAISIPCRTSIGAGLAYGLLLARVGTRSIRRTRSETIRVVGRRGPACVQIDGEKASRVPGLDGGMLGVGQALRVSMSDQRVLMHARPIC